MKKIIRANTFETNSSSTHSLVICSSGREPSKLKTNANGMIEVSFGQFDRDYQLYPSQYDKLSYLLTCLSYLSAEPTIESIYNSWDFARLERIVCNYTGAKGIKILNNIDPYIDHQSVPSGWIEIIDFYDDDAIIDFVFNKYITLKTDGD